MSTQEIVSKNNEGIIPQENYETYFKFFYNLLKNKSDTDIKLFHDNRHFRKRDIDDLIKKMEEKLGLLTLVTNQTNITVGLSDKQIISFSDLSKFKSYDWEISNSTRYITIEWDFNVIFPNSDKQFPERHSVRVRIGNSLKTSDLIQVIFQGGEESEFEESQAQVVCKIDFVNPQLSGELKNIVTGWYEGLSEKIDSSIIVRSLVENSQIVRNFITFTLFITGFIFCEYLSDYFIMNNQSIGTKNFYELLLTSSIVFYLMFILSKILGDFVISKQISKFQRNPIFEFTKGDENKVQEIKKKNNTLLRNFTITLIITILVNVIIYFIGEMLPPISDIIK